MARKTLIILRKDTAANWTSVNPVLASGEQGFETDTGILKIGNGSTAWNSLAPLNKMANLKDITITDLQTNDILKWNGSAWVNAAQAGGHTQNTDSGTTGSTFDIDSDGTGVRLKNDSGVLLLRNLADSAYADLKVKNLEVTGTTLTVNAETVTVDDNIIVLNNNVTGTPSENGGIEVERGTSDNASLIWDETTDKWKCGIAGSEYEISLVGHTHSGMGDVVGPSSATDNAVPRYDTATGKLLQNSLVTIDDNGSVNIPTGQAYKINGTQLGAADVGAIPRPGSEEQGDLLQYGSAAYEVLHHGSQYQMLGCGGHGAVNSWMDIDGGSA